MEEQRQPPQEASLLSVQAGATAGLSGAGITSGLATIGSIVGGGMAAGTALLAVAPVVAAAGVGYGAYKLCKSFPSGQRDLAGDRERNWHWFQSLSTTPVTGAGWIPL